MTHAEDVLWDNQISVAIFNQINLSAPVEENDVVNMSQIP
jgi:hypothetical protein